MRGDALAVPHEQKHARPDGQGVCGRRDRGEDRRPGEGARHPDCHDIAAGPPRPYSRHGSKPIARVQWDDTYTDPHWNHTRLGRPDTGAIDAPAHASPHVRDA